MDWITIKINIPGLMEETKGNSDSDCDQNHEEGDSMFFNSLLMSDLKDEKKG